MNGFIEGFGGIDGHLGFIEGQEGDIIEGWGGLTGNV